jgi:hypothetical protein
VQICRFRYHIRIITATVSFSVAAEAVVALLITLVRAAAAVLLVGEQIHTVTATARPAMLARLVAAAAVFNVGNRIHALAAAASHSGALQE